MEDRIRDLILQSKKGAEEEIRVIKEQDPPDYEFFREHLRSYVLKRFMLTEEDCTTENFNELTDISLSKSMKISKDLVHEFDIARSCAGTTSAMAKRVLLLMSIQKAFGFEYPAKESAYIETLDDLCSLTWKCMTD